MAKKRKTRSRGPKTISAQGLSGQRGVNLIEDVVLRMGSRWTSSGANEVGVDGYIEFFDPATREALGLTVAVQSKVVTALGNAKESFDWWCDQSDLEYWLKGNTPLILVAAAPESREAYWVCIQDYFNDWKPGDSTKITFHKATNSFAPEALRALTEVAAPRQGLYLAPNRRKETLQTNLLPIETLPATVYVGKTHHWNDYPVRKSLSEHKYYPRSGWFLWDKTIITFDDLSGSAWREIVIPGTIDKFDTSDWADTLDPQRQKNFVQLLNRTLKEQISVEIRYCSDQDCYAFAGRPKRHSYRSLKRDSKLGVVNSYSSTTADGRVFHHFRHLAFRGQFRRLSDVWYLEITPTYRFTSDGHNLERFHESRLKGIKEREGNRAVLSIVMFWADYLRPSKHLFSGDPPLIRFGPLLDMSLPVGINDKAWLAADNDALDPDEDEGQEVLALEPSEEKSV